MVKYFPKSVGWFMNGIGDRLCGLVGRVPGYRSRGSVFDSRRYQIFQEVMVLECGPLRLVSTIEELLGRKSSGSGLEIRDYSRRDPVCWSPNTLFRQKLALTSPTSGGRPVGIVRSRTKATEFVCLFVCFVNSVTAAPKRKEEPCGNTIPSRFYVMFNKVVLELRSWQFSGFRNLKSKKMKLLM
jgi:hypothetical protein